MQFVRCLALFVSCIFIASLSFAQVSTGYTFSAANVTAGGNLTGGTLLASGGGIGSATDNAVFPDQPIGFSFKFNGVSYTTVGISTNGFIWFGNTNPATTEYNPISSTTAYAGAVAVYGRDLAGMVSGSELRTITQGTAPNRTFIVNWKQFVATNIFATDENRFDAWIILHECTGIIKTAISANQYPWGFEETFGQVGLRGATNADYFNRAVDCDFSSDWLNSTAGTTNAALANMGTTADFGQCWPGTYSFFTPSVPTVFTFTPTVPNAPVLTCTPAASWCSGTSGNVAVNVTGGTAPFQIDWTFGGAASPSPATGTLSNATFPNSTAVTSTFANAGSGNYAVTVTDGAGCIANCSGNITVNTCNTNTLTTGTISGSPFCPGASVTVPFTGTGTFNSGNVYTAELSDASGSFSSPTVIGSITTTANSGSITTTIPSSTPPGTGYRIRVVSSNPSVTGTDNGVNLTVLAEVAASVVITPDSVDVCSGTMVSFTASPANGGTNPTYQWQINGSNVTGNGLVASYSTDMLNDGDVVTVIMTSNAACVTGSPATSNSVTVNVTANADASVSISPDNNPACEGSNVTFNAVPVNGGASPEYQWQLNGNNVGANNSTYVASGLSDGDQVSVIMTSSSGCVTSAVANSNVVTINFTPLVETSVSIIASDSVICSGTEVTFTATPVNGGSTPSYQWQVNGMNAGSDGPVFTSISLNNDDVVNVLLTSDASCVTGSPATSNAVTMSVTQTMTPEVNITASNTAICEGTEVTFTADATNAGNAPVFQWQLNGTNVGSNASSFSSNTLSDDDNISVTMNVTGECYNPTTVSSNVVSMSVASPVPVTISASAVSVCAFTTVTLKANGGGFYTWSSNATLGCDSCETTTVIPVENTIVTVTSGSGACMTFDTINIDISCDILNLPNAFTPNNDGINDVLRVVGTDIASFEFLVFNRWGEVVFETHNPALGWNGVYNGEPAPVGTYSWFINATNTDGKPMKVVGGNAGNVTLIR